MPGFHWQRSISFGEVDWARILYYPRLFNFCHEAFEAFMEEVLGMPYVDFLAIEKLGFPTVHLEADYLEPFPYGTTMHLEVLIKRVGGKSMELEYLARAAVPGPVRARARITNVLVGMEDFDPRPIPVWIRERLEARLEA
ncbi:MAG: acyl-CoA thioesterase [Planctomycetes bacterium]|nr:acyl-CoA thioesterase [Planctomycetota bacterium]